MMKHKNTIALVGVNLGTGNLGEEITASALKQNIRKILPDANIVHITSNPGDTALRHDSPSIPIHRIAESRNNGLVDNYFSVLPEESRVVAPQGKPNQLKELLKKIPFAVVFVRAIQELPSQFREFMSEIGFLRRSYSRLENVDKIVIAGSGPLIDFFGGPFSYPYLVAKWTFLAKLRSIPVYVFSVGAVPFGSSLSRVFVRYLINNAEYYSFRDETSRDIAANLGISQKGDVYPDIAFSYIAEDPEAQKYEKNSTKRIGVSLFPHFDPRYWPESDPEIYNQYVNTMTEFCAWLIENKYEIVFLSTQIKADILVMNDVIVNLRNQGFDDGQYIIADPVTHEAFMKELSKIELMVVTRFHGMIMTILSNTPVIGLANQAKMFDLMREMGQDDYLLDVEQLSIEALKDMFQKSISSTDAIKQSLKLNCLQNRDDLLQGYRRILQDR